MDGMNVNTMPVGFSPPSAPNSNAPVQQQAPTSDKDLATAIALASALRGNTVQKQQSNMQGGVNQLQNILGNMGGGTGNGAFMPFGGSSFTMPGAGATGEGAGMLTSTDTGTSALGGLGSFGDLGTLFGSDAGGSVSSLGGLSSMGDMGSLFSSGGGAATAGLGADAAAGEGGAAAAGIGGEAGGLGSLGSMGPWGALAAVILGHNQWATSHDIHSWKDAWDGQAFTQDSKYYGGKMDKMLPGWGSDARVAGDLSSGWKLAQKGTWEDMFKNAEQGGIVGSLIKKVF